MVSLPSGRQCAPKNAWTWRCDACGRPIQDGHGYVQLVDPKTGGYPQWTEQDERRAYTQYWAAQDAMAAPDTPGWVAVADVDLPESPQRVRVQAYHRACDPHPERGVYWIDVERARGTDVLDWCAHLAEKEWFGRADLIAFIRRYQNGLCAKDGAR